MQFENLYIAKDLLSGRKLYILIVDGYNIKFITPTNFIDNFSIFLVESIRNQEAEYQRLQGLENEFTDEVQLEVAIKNQYTLVYKQKELLKKIYQLQNVQKP